MDAQDKQRQLLAELEDIDTSSWTAVGGTEAGAYFEAAPDVIVAVPRLGYRQEAADARKSLEEFHRIARGRARPQAIIVLVDRVASQDASSRRVWSEASENGLRCSLALICASGLSRAIGSFFIGLNRPVVPTKMFETFTQALDWSKARVAEATPSALLIGASPRARE
jgi:hypothetical protein